MNKKNIYSAKQLNFTVDESVSLEEQIASRAHELWQTRCRSPRSDLDDWFQAEREIAEWHRFSSGKPEKP